MTDRNSLFAAYEPGRTCRTAAPASLAVRAAQEDDVPALASIAQARDGGELSRYLRAFEDQIRDDGARWHVVTATIGGAVAGFGRSNYFHPPDDAPDNVAPEGWHLAGVVVDPPHRRLGLGLALTEHRLAWLARKTDTAYYFASAQNHVTLDLHTKLGFVEVTRDFFIPGCSFTGGVGILFKVDLRSRR